MQHSTPRNCPPWERGSQPPVRPQEPCPREGGELRGPAVGAPLQQQLPAPTALRHRQPCPAKAPGPRALPGARRIPGSFPRLPASGAIQRIPSGVSRQQRSRFYLQQTLNPSPGPPTPALPGALRSPAPLPRHRRRCGGQGTATTGRGARQGHVCSLTSPIPQPARRADGSRSGGG